MATSRKPRPRRVQAAEPAPGVARVRLSGDAVATDVLAAILAAHPAVEILTGPDRYDDGRQYLVVRVLSPEEVLASLSAERGPAEDALLMHALHPDRDAEDGGNL